MFDLPHVASRIYGAPLFIARSKLETVLSAVTPRLLGEPLAANPMMATRNDDIEITSAGIAIFPIMGTLVRRTSGMSALCGMTSYQQLAETAYAVFNNPQVKGVIMDIDSGGGEAGGLFDFVDELSSIASTAGKPLWAVSNEAALSAAYAIACTADTIYLTRTAEVGSVGVVALHVDESGADSQAGLSYTYIHAGAKKVDGNPHEPLGDDVKRTLQHDVDTLYTQFAEFVAKRRHCSPEQIRATEAAIYRGQEALDAGLADKIGTLKQAHDAMTASLLQATHTGRLSFSNSQTKEISMADVTVEAQMEETEKQTTDELTASIEEKTCARMAELTDIARQAKHLGVTVDAVAAFKEGISADTLRKKVLEDAAMQDEKLDIVAASSVESQKIDDNRLLSAVQKLHHQEAK